MSDDDLLPGFPIFIGAGGLAAPKTADINGDGVREIVYADNDGYVHVFKGDGSELDQMKAITGGDMYEVVTDATGNHRSMANALHRLRATGRCRSGRRIRMWSRLSRANRAHGL